MKILSNAIGHFKTISNHKKLVMEGCFKAGLYKQGILHDLSKYSPAEFFVGVKYYQGDRSPNNAEREATGVTKAWLHHKGRNKHHLEYWIDYSVNGDHALTGMKMPKKYVVEMFVDRVSACKNYQKEAYRDDSALKYYEKGKSRYLLHEDTAWQLYKLLKILADHGEDYTYRYIRRKVLRNDARGRIERLLKGELFKDE
ncbi:MAG: DUF5662 family protein [Lachnospiraceae bacterium]|nr:DUF5662 family protein [Lachnospiraceae bacterium]